LMGVLTIADEVPSAELTSVAAGAALVAAGAWLVLSDGDVAVLATDPVTAELTSDTVGELDGTDALPAVPEPKPDGAEPPSSVVGAVADFTAEVRDADAGAGGASTAACACRENSSKSRNTPTATSVTCSARRAMRGKSRCGIE
jgi:hypothetical protein